MKVYIGKYKNWFGPYQLADALCFWVKDVEDEYGMKSKPDWVHNFGEFLAHGFHKEKSNRFLRDDRPQTWLYKFLSWIDSFKKRVMYVKIDKYDTWSMDHTLAPIILPMLKQLKATKHGSPHVELEDVPEFMRTTTYEEWDSQKVFDFYLEDKYNTKYDVHERWDWVLSEMIFAFEHLVDDSWEDEFRSGEADWISEPCKWDENGKATLFQMKDGPNHTYKCDYDGMEKVYKRMENGFRLFGKYYRNLWD